MTDSILDNLWLCCRVKVREQRRKLCTSTTQTVASSDTHLSDISLKHNSRRSFLIFHTSTLLQTEKSEAEMLCDAAGDVLKKAQKLSSILLNVGVSGYMLSFSTLISYLQFLLTPLHFVMYSSAHIHSPPYSFSLSVLRELVVLTVANSSHLAN